MTDWQQVLDSGTVPTHRPVPDLVTELSAALRSPDPVLRDRQAYSVLAGWIDRGVLDTDALTALGDEMAARFDDPLIQARTFAPLILDCVVSAGRFDEKWVEAFSRWYPTEADVRGHDPELGWLHAVAHGADLLAAFGRCPQLTDPARMLDVASRRLVAPTGTVWRDQEDDRLGFAIALTLTRDELTEETAIAWLAPIETGFASWKAGPPSPPLTNALRTLRMLYLLVDRGVRPDWRGGDAIPVVHREVVKERLAAVLAGPAPFAG